MKLILNIKPATFEKVNSILSHAITEIESSEKAKKYFNLTEKQIEDIKEFRNQMLDKFLKKASK